MGMGLGMEKMKKSNQTRDKVTETVAATLGSLSPMPPLRTI